MPQQETFLEQTIGGRRIEVLKIYDQAYARETFHSMDDDALQRLWTSLKPEEIYDPASLPTLNDPAGDGEAFLWDELLEQAREDGPVMSYFSSTRQRTDVAQVCSCRRIRPLQKHSPRAAWPDSVAWISGRRVRATLDLYLGGAEVLRAAEF